MPGDPEAQRVIFDNRLKTGKNHSIVPLQLEGQKWYKQQEKKYPGV